jgi:hypothetical protein
MCHKIMNRLKKKTTPGLKGHDSKAPEIARSSKNLLQLHNSMFNRLRIFPFNESLFDCVNQPF